MHGVYGRCLEVVVWWTHHVQDLRAKLGEVDGLLVE